MPAWLLVLLPIVVAVAVLLAFGMGWSRSRTGGQNTTIVEDRRPDDHDTTVSNEN
jgi:hypothetical protein